MNVTVCDHTLNNPELIGTSDPKPYSGAEHTVTHTYKLTCLCGEKTETDTEDALVAHDKAPATLKYKPEHEKLGHRKYYVCSCGEKVLLGGANPTKDSYYSYIEALGSSNNCSACHAIYEEQKLIKELQTLLKKRGYDLGTYGPNKDGIDGDFGTKTKDAINDFRNRVMGLGAISNVYEVDKATWDALRNGVKEEVSENEELLVPGECSVYASGHKMIVEYTNEHPHAYLKCACGKTTPSNVESLSCCECGYHEWSEPQYISGIQNTKAAFITV